MLAGSQSATWLNPVQARQKKFLNIRQFTAPDCAAITPCHKFTEGNIIKSTDFEMYRMGKKNLHTASRYVKETVLRVEYSNRFQTSSTAIPH